MATPGRLIDHLENTPGIAEAFRAIKILIFDEADQLLEMGFKPEIDKILKYVPPKEARQTLLFSATVPKSVQTIAANALRPGFKYVDTVGEEEVRMNVSNFAVKFAVRSDRQQQLGTK